MMQFEVHHKTKEKQFKVLSARMMYDVVLFLDTNTACDGVFIIHVIGDNGADDWLSTEEFNERIVGDYKC